MARNGQKEAASRREGYFYLPANEAAFLPILARFMTPLVIAGNYPPHRNSNSSVNKLINFIMILLPSATSRTTKSKPDHSPDWLSPLTRFYLSRFR